MDHDVAEVEGYDILARPVEALDRAEVVVERFKAAVLAGDLEEAERQFLRLEMFKNAAAEIILGRERRLGVA